MGVIGDAISKARKNIQDFKEQQLSTSEDIAMSKEIRDYDERKRKIKTEKKRQKGQRKREKKETKLQEKLINKGLVDGTREGKYGENDDMYDAAGTDDGLYSDEKAILKQHRREKLKKFFSDVRGAVTGQSGNVQMGEIKQKETQAYPEGAVEKAKSQVIEQDKPKPQVWHEDGMGGQYTREMEKLPTPKGYDLHPQYKIDPIPLERNVGKIGGDYKEFIKGIQDIDGKKNNP